MILKLLATDQAQFCEPEISIIFVQRMKKLIAAISFIVYLAASSGVVINSHYCMKKLVSIHLFETKAEVCGFCGMEMHDNSGCCHDVTQFVKMVQDQVKIPVTVFELPAVEAVLPEQNEWMFSSLYNVDEERHFHNHSPPLISGQDTYLQNRVFRI